MRALIPPKNLNPLPRQARPDACTSCDKPINPLTGECAGCTGS